MCALHKRIAAILGEKKREWKCWGEEGKLAMRFTGKGYVGD